MKKMKAPVGSEGANFGTKLFKLDDNGDVFVPDEAVETLSGVGGFELIIEPQEIPQGQVKLRSLIGPQSCSSDGISYSTGENDEVIVPTDVAEALLSHGFVLVEDEKNVAPAAPAAEEPAPVVEAVPVEIPVAEVAAAEPVANTPQISE